MVKSPIMSPGTEDMENLDNLVIASRIASFLCNKWSQLVVKHLGYHRLNHVVPVNRSCVIMSCSEMDVGKSHEIAFSMTVQRDFQSQFLKSSLRHNFY